MYREENKCSLTVSPQDTSPSFWRTLASPLSTSVAVISTEETIFQRIQTSPHIPQSTRNERSATAAGLEQYLFAVHTSWRLPAPLVTGQLLGRPEREPVIDTTLS